LLDSETRLSIRDGVASARKAMEERVRTMGKKVNGWASTDVFGKREFYAGDYLLRAAAAMAGWGGNDAVEAYYPMVREDEAGKPLNGASQYRLTFGSLPPARAFWSVTMYDTSYDGTAGYLVENPIDRYRISSTSEGLVFGGDGSLEITIQRDPPAGAGERANWLPAPDGPFYLVLRIYWPEQAALDGGWTPPPVRCLG
jgi:hypothetical protein